MTNKRFSISDWNDWGEGDIIYYDNGEEMGSLDVLDTLNKLDKEKQELEEVIDSRDYEISELSKQRDYLANKNKALELKIKMLEQIKPVKRLPAEITVRIETTEELLGVLAQLEYEQWCYWSKGLSDDYRRLIGLTPIEYLSGEDHDFIVSQLDRLDRWQYLWDSDYEDIPEDLKETDYMFAEQSLKEIESALKKTFNKGGELV